MLRRSARCLVGFEPSRGRLAFGTGVVKAATGRGDDAKLTIEFPDGTKTLLGKFVKR